MSGIKIGVIIRIRHTEEESVSRAQRDIYRMVDIMYQPYPSYLPYQRPTAHSVDNFKVSVKTC